MQPIKRVFRQAILNPASMITRSQRLRISSDQLVVKHDQTASIFYIDLNSERAVLEYEKLGDVINFYETTVPDRFQRQSIAKLLAKSAFDYAINNNHKMQLSCTYLQKYYHENYDKYKNYVLDEEVLE